MPQPAKCPVTNKQWWINFHRWLKLGWPLLKRSPKAADQKQAGAPALCEHPTWFANGEPRAVVSLLGIVFQHYTSQNRLLWGRVNVLLAIQGAGLAACYKLGGIPGCIVAVSVALLTAILLVVLKRDRECRNANLELMRTLEDVLLPGEGWAADPAPPPQKKGKSADSSGPSFPTKIRVGVRPRSRWTEGGKLLVWVARTLILVDAIMAVLAILDVIPVTSGPRFGPAVLGEVG